MNITNYIKAKFFGKYVGKDSNGNAYYISKSLLRTTGKENRFVRYASKSDNPLTIDSAWYSWLHYQTDELPNTTFCNSRIVEYNNIKIKKKSPTYNRWIPNEK